MRNKSKKEEKCWKCGDKYFTGHLCAFYARNEIATVPIKEKDIEKNIYDNDPNKNDVDKDYCEKQENEQSSGKWARRYPIKLENKNRVLAIWEAGSSEKLTQETGCKLYTFEGHEAPIYSICPHSKVNVQFIFYMDVKGKIKAWLYGPPTCKIDYDAPSHGFTTRAYSANGSRLFTSGTNKGESYLVEKEKVEEQPIKYPIEPIKYPIEDSLVQPGPDDSVFTKRPCEATDFLTPMDCVGDILMVWDFCTSFGKALRLWPFSLEDFEKAIEYTKGDVTLLAETHYALLRIVAKDSSAYQDLIQKRKSKLSIQNWQNHLYYFLEAEELKEAVRKSFAEIDKAFAKACLLHTGLSSGTTALTVVVSGRILLVANAGDSRAVLSRHGKAVEMSRNHGPCCIKERKHTEGMKNVGAGGGPLSAEPEIKKAKLSKDDEFLIVGCDGIWEAFTSQNAVDFARRKLQEHNDLETCCKELVDEAIKRETMDNLTAVMVCFHSEPPPNLVVNRPRVRRSISAEGFRSLQGFLDSLHE